MRLCGKRLLTQLDQVRGHRSGSSRPFNRCDARLYLIRNLFGDLSAPLDDSLSVERPDARVSKRNEAPDLLLRLGHGNFECRSQLDGEMSLAYASPFYRRTKSGPPQRRDDYVLLKLVQGVGAPTGLPQQWRYRSLSSSDFVVVYSSMSLFQIDPELDSTGGLNVAQGADEFITGSSATVFA